MTGEVIADIGKYVTGRNGETLMCLALGSCVGVAMFDEQVKAGGLAHIMLPSSEGIELKEGVNVNKFADIALPNMLKDIQGMGCLKQRTKAKIAGGAHMFRGIESVSMSDIGKRNVESVKSVLANLGIEIISEDTGGEVGRTTRLDLNNFSYHIRTKEGEKDI